MANYYGYNAGTNNQQYSLPSASNTGYGSTAYNLPPPNPYIPQQNIQQQPQPPQQQQAFVTYGQIGQSNQTYPSYNYSNTSTNQASSYGKVAQTPQYYHTTTTNARPSTTPGYYNNSQQPTPQNRLYGSTYTQQIQPPLQPTPAPPPVPPPQQQQQQVSINRVNNTSMLNTYRSTSTTISTNNNMQSSYGIQARQTPNNNSGYGANIQSQVQNNSNFKSSGAYGNHNANKSGNTAQSKSMSNYEKALLNVASTMYQQQRRGGGGVSKGGFQPKWKQNRRERDPNKPIVAAEVKGYLYAWLSKRRQRPDYNISAHGSTQFRQSYVCELLVNGHQYVGKGNASNKKDSQTRAAWDFCDYLIREGKMTQSELPIRESKFEASKNKLPSTYNKEMTDQERVTSIAKKKVVAQKINFVGGSSLNLSASNAEPIGTSIKPTVSKVETVASNYPENAKSYYNIGPQSHPKQPNNSKNVEDNNDSSSSKKNDPVGEDYVTQVWTDGRVIRYRCSLCECEFNDPCAKELHIRGRRHKLSYKTKVDASLEVDVKLNPRQKNLMMLKIRQESRKNAFNERRKKQKQWELEKKKQEEHEIMMYEEGLFYQYQEELIRYEEEAEFHRRRSLSLPLHVVPPIRPVMRYFQAKLQKSQQIRTSEDQHVIAKHQRIYPTENELIMVQDTVQLLETAFKEVSTSIHEQEIKVYALSKTAQIRPTPERLLKAVLRMGNLANGLLLRGDLNVELVLMCNSKPTATLLHRVAENLPKHLGANPEMSFSFKTDVGNCCIIVTTKEDPIVNVKVYLTSTLMRSSNDDAATKESATATAIAKPDPPDILDVHKCCQALASLRHAKWFQAKATGLQPCVLTTRIFKDLCVRVPTWSPLSSWAIELLVERVISSSTLPLSPSVAVKRVFEVLASGILLPGGLGISDPCERKPTDAAVNLAPQEREDITGSAQHALRLLAFRNIHKVLAMEKLPTKEETRKRREEQSKDEEDVKKMKME